MPKFESREKGLSRLRSPECADGSRTRSLSAMNSKGPWWLRIGRRLFPESIWNGAGAIVDKAYRAPYTGDALVSTGKGMVYGSGTVNERWVLVVKDSAGKDHYVNVEQQVWHNHSVGDTISANDPLVNLP